MEEKYSKFIGIGQEGIETLNAFKNKLEKNFSFEEINLKQDVDKDYVRALLDGIEVLVLTYNSEDKKVRDIVKAISFMAVERRVLCIGLDSSLKENKDEMGRLCREFERMKEQLAENNHQLWKMIEEEKALRAAIAHDIRSPLSVLAGYQEMLSEYLPEEEIDMDRALGMVNESKKQIERMDTFVETMRKMSSLDTRELVVEEITSMQLEIDIQAELNVFEKKFGKRCELECVETAEKFSGDKEVILEVIENLLSNAFRYAKTKVEMEVFFTSSELQIRIKDDGVGFTVDKQKATELFYQQNVKDSLKHSGMGMYISRLYCEKHGGQLLIENEKQSGAVITAVFHRIA